MRRRKSGFRLLLLHIEYKHKVVIVCVATQNKTQKSLRFPHFDSKVIIMVVASHCRNAHKSTLNSHFHSQYWIPFCHFHLLLFFTHSLPLMLITIWIYNININRLVRSKRKKKTTPSHYSHRHTDEMWRSDQLTGPSANKHAVTSWV